MSTLTRKISQNKVGLSEDLSLYLIQCALSRQITKHGLEPSLSDSTCRYRLALSIVEHLRTLLSHHPTIINESLRSAYRSMLIDWETISRVNYQNLHKGKSRKWYH